MQRLGKHRGSENYYVNLGTINGRQVIRSTGCRDRRAAEARARELEREARAPRETAPTPALHTAYERAVNEIVSRGRAAATVEMWLKKGKNLLRLLGADTPLGEIDARAIDAYQEQRRAEGVVEQTIAKELGCLHVTLKIARRRGEYPHDVAAVMPVEMHRESTPRTRALSPAEARALIADMLDDNLVVRGRKPGRRSERCAPQEAIAVRCPTCKAEPGALCTSRYGKPHANRTRLANPPRQRREPDRDGLYECRGTRTRSMKNRAAMIAFILATSARWGEAVAAERTDIVLEGDGGYVTLRGTKTKGAARVVPILPTTAPLIAIVLEHGRAEGPLFDAWTNIRGDMLRACRRIGIAPCTPNDWRRTTATWLHEAGVEPHLIAKVLGHTTSRMVETTYGQMSPEALGGLLRERIGDNVVPLMAGAGRKAKAG